MKRFKERMLACFLVALMMCNVFTFGSIQAKAATTYMVTTETELLTALSSASDGDIINVGSEGNDPSIQLTVPLEITKDLTFNLYGSIDYYTDDTSELPEAVVVIKNCDVTISGSSQFGCGITGLYAYKLVDESGDTSLTIDSYGMLDEGMLIVDDASNAYTPKVIINNGYYSIPEGRTTAFAFSNGTETSVVSNANLVINGGSFQENIEAYIGKDTVIVDNGEEHGCRYEVRSSIMSEQFQSMLTDGKIIVPSAVPEDEIASDAYLMGFLSMYETDEVLYYPGHVGDGVYDIGAWNNETGELVEMHRVEVVFDADLDAKALAVAEDVVEKIPYESDSWEWEGVVYESRCSTFLITDMEAVNMWASGYDRNNLIAHRHTVNYSGELKEYLGNSNVDFRVTMIGAGCDTDLYLEACGDAVILINDIMYASVPHMIKAQVEHIVYVPDGTTTDKDSLMAAAQKRINEYLGSDSKVVVSYGGAYNTMSNTWWNSDDADYQAEMMDYLGLETAPEHYFIATAGDMQYKFLIMVDSSKMITPTYKTVDASSNVSISSQSADIPLDTSIRVNQLTSGETYDKVIDTLGVDENVTYDLKLYSQSTSSYVSELENGTFEVQIPLTASLKDKELAAYYVDENNQIEEYEVTVKDGSATFTTDHFSIYTLAPKKANTGGESAGTTEPEQEPTYEVVAPPTNAAAGKVGDTVDELKTKVPFTEEEKALIDAGAEVTFTLEVKDIASTVSDTDKTLVASKLENKTVGMYLDINMFKQVGTNSAVKVPELNGKMEIQITIPDSLINKDTNINRVYSIVRIHDGVATVLDAKFDATTKVLTFETDAFSTYALVYADETVTQTPPATTPTTTPTSPNTGDATMVGCMMMLLVSGVAVLASKKRRSF